MDRVRSPVAFALLLITAMLLVGCADEDDTAIKLGGTLPTVSLLANPTTVNSGGSSTLTWTSSDATSCNAGGAWSGSKPLSGSESVGPLARTTTFTLTCAGLGGSTNRPVTVTVDPSSAILQLSWPPNADPINGYITYSGPSAGTASTQLSAIPLTSSGFDPQAPAVEYDAATDLGLNTGDTVCFRLKAYNSAGSSGFSGATCIAL